MRESHQLMIRRTCHSSFYRGCMYMPVTCVASILLTDCEVWHGDPLLCLRPQMYMLVCLRLTSPWYIAGVLATFAALQSLAHCRDEKPPVCDISSSSVPGTLREATRSSLAMLLSPSYTAEASSGQPAVWLRWWIPSLQLKSAGVPPVMYTALKPKTGEL